MRTDAKIGFAIGGVLLAVLAVYLIVVPKHSNKKTVALAPSAEVTHETPPTEIPSIVVPTPTPPLTAASEASTSALPVPTPLASVSPPSDDHVKPMIPDVRETHSPAVDTRFHPASPFKNTETADAASDGPFVRGGNMLGNETASVPALETRRTTNAKRTTRSDHSITGERVVSASARQYTVKSGQTLSSIASDVYGNSRFWVAIQRENTGLDAKHLKVGQKINLPDISEVRPGPVLVDVIEPVATVGGTEVDPAAHTYRVQSGDSLYKISKKLFGSGRRTSAIYKLNKDLIGDDESKLKRGMLLKLPDEPRIAASAMQ